MGGAVLTAYLARGGPASFLGLPTSAQVGLSGGAAQTFAGGRVLLRPATRTSPARAFRMGAAAGSRYDAAGGPAGPLGWPVADQRAVRGGTSVLFGAHLISTAAASGSRSVLIGGGFLKTYTAAGGADSCLGLPTREAYAITGGTRGDFQRGSITYRKAGGTYATACR